MIARRCRTSLEHLRHYSDERKAARPFQPARNKPPGTRPPFTNLARKPAPNGLFKPATGLFKPARPKEDEKKTFSFQNRGSVARQPFKPFVPNREYPQKPGAPPREKKFAHRNNEKKEETVEPVAEIEEIVEDEVYVAKRDRRTEKKGDKNRRKSDLYDKDEQGSPRDKERRRKQEKQRAKKEKSVLKEVVIPEGISVMSLATLLGKSAGMFLAI